MIGYDGTGWGRPMEINPTGFGLSGVSCPSVSLCMAVDGDGSATTFHGAVVSPNVWGFGSVSCVSSSSCVATDSAGNAVQFDGSAWAAPVGVDAGGIGLVAVSCAGTMNCVALTSAGDAYQGCGCGCGGAVSGAAAARAAGPPAAPTNAGKANPQTGRGTAQTQWQLAGSHTQPGAVPDERRPRR